MSSKSSPKARRTAARLASVQTLYQLELGDGPARRAVHDMMLLRQEDITEELVEPDQDLLKQITEGVSAKLSQVDGLIVGALGAGRAFERTEPVLRAILRAGTYELLSDAATPHPIVINDYVNVAHAFFSSDDPADRSAVPSKVNAVLNVVATQLGRSVEV